jgi:extracellular factor (EF) 3-hydroxypalmitic acid methyl ester biosynthesis protein
LPNCEIKYLNENVLKFALRSTGNPSVSFDLVYAAGLFDYFTPNNARRLVAGLWRYVTRGGALVITNAHPANPTRTWMEYGGDWFLQYKDEDAMYALTEGLKDVADMTVTSDSFGVYRTLRVTRE